MHSSTSEAIIGLGLLAVLGGVVSGLSYLGILEVPFAVSSPSTKVVKPSLAGKASSQPASQQVVTNSLPARALGALSNSVTVIGESDKGDAATKEDRVGLPPEKATPPAPQKVVVDLSGLPLAQTARVPETLKQLRAQASPLVPLVLTRAATPPAPAEPSSQIAAIVPAAPAPATTAPAIPPREQAQGQQRPRTPAPVRTANRVPLVPTTSEGLPDIAQILRLPIARWERFNEDPFSRDPVLARTLPMRERAFREMGLTGACFEEALRLTSTPGRPGRLHTGDRLLVSQSGSGPHWNQIVAFASVTGYSGVGYVLDTEEWDLTCGRTTVTIVWPKVCENVGLKLPDSPALVVVAECVEVDYDDGIAGDIVRIAGITSRELPPSGCWARWKDGRWVQIESPCGDCDWTDVVVTLPNGGVGYRARYTFKYEIETSGPQRIRMPLEMKAEYPALCVIRNMLRSLTWVVGTSLWQSNIYHIPDNVRGGQWPVWDPRALMVQYQQGIIVR
ncbi:MAG: hypothetical protein Q7R54_01915 [bacterium]|nr:hypothetical protein [bacterium]